MAHELTKSNEEVGAVVQGIVEKPITRQKSKVDMRGDRKSILLCLLIVIKSIGKVTSLDSNDIIAALDSTDKTFQSDPSNVSLQQQRLDEIRALSAMQSKAAAERDARDKVARNFKEAADRQSADAAERQSAASSAKDALDLAEKEVHESTPEEINNAGGELAAAVSNSIEELIVQNLDSVVEVTMKYAERDQDDADESDKDLNLSSTESTNTTPDVMLNSATSAIFDSKTSEINNEDVDDEDVDHEDDVMKEVSIDLLSRIVCPVNTDNSNLLPSFSLRLWRCNTENSGNRLRRGRA